MNSNSRLSSDVRGANLLKKKSLWTLLAAPVLFVGSQAMAFWFVVYALAFIAIKRAITRVIAAAVLTAVIAPTVFIVSTVTFIGGVIFWDVIEGAAVDALVFVVDQVTEEEDSTGKKKVVKTRKIKWTLTQTPVTPTGPNSPRYDCSLFGKYVDDGEMVDEETRKEVLNDPEVQQMLAGINDPRLTEAMRDCLRKMLTEALNPVDGNVIVDVNDPVNYQAPAGVGPGASMASTGGGSGTSSGGNLTIVDPRSKRLDYDSMTVIASTPQSRALGQNKVFEYRIEVATNQYHTILWAVTGESVIATRDTELENNRTLRVYWGTPFNTEYTAVFFISVNPLTDEVTIKMTNIATEFERMSIEMFGHAEGELLGDSMFEETRKETLITVKGQCDGSSTLPDPTRSEQEMANATINSMYTFMSKMGGTRFAQLYPEFYQACQ